MGRPKALLPWGGVPLVRHQVDLLAAQPAIDQVDRDRRKPCWTKYSAALDGSPARVVANPRFREGRATSLAAGARALKGGPTGVLVVSVDQPLAPMTCSTRWSRPAGAHPILKPCGGPTYAGRGGHPLIVPADVVPGTRTGHRGHPGPPRRGHPPPPPPALRAGRLRNSPSSTSTPPPTHAAAEPSSGPGRIA